MAWVPIEESGLVFDFFGSEGVSLVDSHVLFDSGELPVGSSWWFQFFDAPVRSAIRVTAVSYSTWPGNQSSFYSPAYIEWRTSQGIGNVQVNEAPPYPEEFLEDDEGVTYFTPSPFEISEDDEIIDLTYRGSTVTYDGMPNDMYFDFLIEVWDDVPVEVDPFYVYEAEKGWTFDGKYIPHYIELNWLFQEDPFTYHEYQKVRIHGLTKGDVNLQVAMSGMQGDVSTDYLEDYTEPQLLDLPFTPIHVQEEYKPTTNYTDVVSRGIGIQMKFEGSNTDVNLPEPAHVIQVLALQGSPQGNGKRAN